MHNEVEESNDVLHRHGYRLTPQRYLVLRVIQDANEHMSLEQIAERVQHINPRVSLSTIYRTLELLKQLGIVSENHLPGRPSHYEMRRGNTHHHLVCQHCHKTIHLDENLLGNLPEHLQRQYSFHFLSLNLLASGYCDDCWQSTHGKVQAPLQDEGEL
jgi:Fur family ferric uptake transcriptional regulator